MYATLSPVYGDILANNNGKNVHCPVVKANLSSQKEKELAEAFINQDLFDKDICKTKYMDS